MDSESILVSTNVLVPEEGLTSRHSGSDLESSAIWKWLSWPAHSSLVNVPGLVETIVASVVNDVSVVSVTVSVNIEAVVGSVSDVSSGSIEPSDLFGGVSSELSDNNGNVGSELLSSLVRDGV
jgi:hypothetical protein